MAALVDGTWYSIGGNCGLEYRKVSYDTVTYWEEFRCTTTGFAARWNAEATTQDGILTGTGEITNMGSRAYMRETSAAQYEMKWTSRNAPFTKIKKDWRYDGKHWTPGTGGTERKYTHPLWRIAMLHPKARRRKRAENILIAWTAEQMHRPFSQVPWTYGTDDHWAVSGRTSGTKVPPEDGAGGWNRTDIAHCSRPQHWHLACLNHPLGEMIMWMEWRTIAEDSNETLLYRFNSPRKVGWALVEATRAHVLGFGNAHADITTAFFGGETPAQWLTTLNTQLQIEWPVRYPEEGDLDEQTDPKVLPQVRDPSSVNWHQLQGRYSWQVGFALYGIAYCHKAEALATTPNAALLALGVSICDEVVRAFSNGLGWSSGYGLSYFSSEAICDAVSLEAQNDHFAKWGDWIELESINHAGGWGARKIPKRDYTLYPAVGFAYIKGLSHTVSVDANTHFTIGDEPHYLDPFFALIEGLAQPV